MNIHLRAIEPLIQLWIANRENEEREEQRRLSGADTRVFCEVVKNERNYSDHKTR